MLQRPSTVRDFSIVAATLLGLATILVPATSRPALAQTSSPAASAEPAKPGAASKVTAKSKETWADMKARWARQKDRWAECQRQEKLEKRSATATRAYLENCMKQ